jgi:hypothetical protein
MSDEIRTAADLRTSIVDQRGGIERFDGPQRRLLDALVFELAKKPNEIDVRVVTDLMAMLPRPVVGTGDDRDTHEAAIAPLLKLYRHLHTAAYELSAENAQLRARLGISPALPERGVANTDTLGGPQSVAITPSEADVCPPGEHLGVPPMRGPDDPRRPNPAIIEAKANPPAASAAPAPEPWQDWIDRGQQGGPRYDRWANRNGT